MKILNKAAIFGLDARIALMTFGILSVVSMAFLHSAMEESEAVAFLAEMEEIGKAFQSFSFDTKEFLLRNNDTDNTISDYYMFKVKNLVQNIDSYENWKGAYISYIPNSDASLNHRKYKDVMLLALNNKSWGGAVGNWSPAGYCSAGEKCYLWVLINGVPSESIAKEIDIKVDKADGASSGSFRWYKSNDPVDKVFYFYKYMAIINPND